MLGAFLVQDALGVPSIDGKDSMSGSYKDISVPPSLVSFAFAPCDCSKLVSRAFKSVVNNVYIVKTKTFEDGTPDFQSLKDNISRVSALIAAGQIAAATVVGTGGIAACVSQMCFGNNLGFAFEAGFQQELFCDNYLDMIIETKETLNDRLVGKTTAESFIAVENATIDLENAQKAWEAPLSTVFSRKYSQKIASSERTPQRNPIVENIQNKGIPHVLIPIFSGTSGEYSLEKQFKTAGATVESLLFKTSSIKESFADLANALKNSTVLAILSGMSAGAEPEAAAKMITIILKEPQVAAAKMITIILKEPQVAAAINDMIARGGLIIGVGEGFKALIGTGLIEHGTIAKQTASLCVE